MEGRLGGKFQQVNGGYVWTAGSSLSLFKFFQHCSVNVLLDKKYILGASLVTQLYRICLPMQETWVQYLIQEDTT